MYYSIPIHDKNRNLVGYVVVKYPLVIISCSYGKILRKPAYGGVAVWLKIPFSLAAALAVPITTITRTMHAIIVA